MNDIINKFLFAGDKFMPEMQLKQPGFTYSACLYLYIYKYELDQACFQHDMAHGDFKDLKKRTVADKVLRDKAFNIAKNPKYNGYQRGLVSMIYKFFDKKTKGSGVTLANRSAMKSIPQNEQLADELHKRIIRKF